MKFFYYNNKTKPAELLLKVEAENILKADEKFKEKTGFDPVKCSWIGCEIVKEIV